MKVRLYGTAIWCPAIAQNISQTGILFRASQEFHDKSDLEMVLEMPVEIIGQKHLQVMARGMVVRVAQSAQGDGERCIAAAILDYRVLHENASCEERPGTDH